MSTPPEGQPPSGPYGAPPFGPSQVQPYGSPTSGGQSYGAQPPLDAVSVLGLVLAFLLAPVGLVLSIVGLFRTSGRRRRGRGFAIAGVIVSVVLLLIAAAVIVALVAFTTLFVTVASQAEDPFVIEEDSFGDEGMGEDPLPLPSPDEPTAVPSVLPPPPEDGEGSLQPPAPLPLGESAPVGPLLVTVSAVDLDGDAEVAAADPANPTPEGRYVLVNGTVENTSEEPQAVYFGLNLAYASAAGELFGELTCEATLTGQASDVVDLEAGASADVVWCFDVPETEVGDGTVAASAALDRTGQTTVTWSDR